MAFTSAEIRESFDEETSGVHTVAREDISLRVTVRNPGSANSPVMLAPLPRTACCHECGALFGTEHAALLHRSFYEAHGRSCNRNPLPMVTRPRARSR